MPFFSYGDRVLPSSLKDKFYVHVSSIRTSVSWIKEQGWYEKGQQSAGHRNWRVVRFDLRVFMPLFNPILMA
ncbi:MAG: hypothetical protein IPL65_09610 [Lewinellaceae bacterium]|nr:hypothetical protein [Lewinellaceae bacterium]